MRRFDTSSRTRLICFRSSFLHAVALAACLAVFAGSAHAATINVPGNQPTIQAAITAASDGDTVLVAPGTYYENINFLCKAITVTSSGGPSVTTINGGGAGTVVTFDTNEGSDSVLSGFTITNGAQGSNYTHGEVVEYDGGGIFISFASPTITGNVITANTACNGGGGIAALSSSALIQGNTVTNNGQAGCTSGIGGGGILVEDSGSVQLIGNTISGNTWSGAEGGGGGIAVNDAGTPTVENNSVSNNSASYGGGIFSLNGGSPYLIVQNLVVNNDAGQGAGLYLGSGHDIAVNNTVAGNTSGAAVRALGGYYSELYNNLIIAVPGQWALDCYFGPLLVLANNDAFSSFGSYGGTCAGMDGANGNISADPLFANPSSNFHLLSSSPAIDAGVNSAPGLPSTDLDQNSRINGSTGVVDMGVYEFYPASDTVSPASLVFNGQPAGTTSAAQTVTVTNTGNRALYTSISVDANFAETDDCAPSVAPGGNCSVQITFTPRFGGTFEGNLAVLSNAAGGPQTVALSGTGLGPTVTLSPISLAFESQPIGSTSPPQTLTLTNSGNQPLDISNTVAGGDFAQTNDCGTNVAAGASCSIRVTFTPSYLGTRTGAIGIYDNALNSPQWVNVSGTGVAQTTASLSPTTWSFGDQRVGTTSGAQSLTLSNAGSWSLGITSIAAAGDFAQTNNCGLSLPANASCTINVTFSPSAAGARTGTVTVTDNASNSPQSVSLSGTGTAPAVSLSPSGLIFAGQQVGTASAAQAVTLTNSGSASLTIASIVAGGDFAQTNNCASSLAVNASCTISVTFSPASTGARTGAVTITDNAAGSPQSVALSGTGTAPLASLSPASLNLGSQVVGTASAALTTTLSNPGNAVLTITGIGITGDFAQTNNCGSTLAPGANCSISVTFRPSTTGTRAGALTVTSDSSGGPVSVALSGNGTEYAPIFSPTSLVFSNQVVGTKSGGKNVKLTANGPGPLVISSISVTGDFLESSNCPASLNKGQSCNITINFQPSAGGPAAGTIVVNDNGLGSPQLVPVSGNGLDFTLAASPSSVSVNAGQAAQYSVTATQVGGSFNNNVSLTCSGLPAGSKCQFSPSGIAPKTGSASSSLSLSTTAGASGTPPGNYSITIIGTSGSLQHAAQITLVVN